MGFLLGIHHIGTTLMLITAILLMVASISAPIVNGLALLKISFANNRSRTSGVNFGSFGYCQFSSSYSDYCQRSLGYNPMAVVNAIDNRIDNGSVGRHTASGLTRPMVLHPVGAMLSFLGFLLAIIGTNVFSALGAGILSLLTWIVTIVAVASDFTSLSIVHHRVNQVRGNKASYGSALWCVIAAVVTSFFATIIVLLTCCASRRSKNKNKAAKTETSAGFGESTVPKKKFWQRR